MQPFVPEYYSGGQLVTDEAGFFCPRCMSLFPKQSEPAAVAPELPELKFAGYATARQPNSAPVHRIPAKLGRWATVWTMVRAFCSGGLRVHVRLAHRHKQDYSLETPSLTPRLRA